MLESKKIFIFISFNFNRAERMVAVGEQIPLADLVIKRANATMTGIAKQHIEKVKVLGDPHIPMV